MGGFLDLFGSSSSSSQTTQTYAPTQSVQGGSGTTVTAGKTIYYQPTDQGAVKAAAAIAQSGIQAASSTANQALTQSRNAVNNSLQLVDMVHSNDVQALQNQQKQALQSVLTAQQSQSTQQTTTFAKYSLIAFLGLGAVMVIAVRGKG